jgi:hypothetical protein
VFVLPLGYLGGPSAINAATVWAIVGTRVPSETPPSVSPSDPRRSLRDMSTQALGHYVFNPAWNIIRSITSGFRASFPGGCQWDADKMPDLQGYVAIVTGGNTGIGKATCKVCATEWDLWLLSLKLKRGDQALLKKNAKVYLAARDERKASAAIEELEMETGKRAHYLHLDLASLKSVKTSAETFLR